MADLALTGLTGSFTLPSGMNAKIARFFIAENRRWKDSEGFIDAGFQTGKLTGQRLAGRVVGYVISTAPLGIGTAFENVTILCQADTGRVLTFTADVTDIEWGEAVGEITAFSASFVSNGTYTAGSL